MIHKRWHFLSIFSFIFLNHFSQQQKKKLFSTNITINYKKYPYLTFSLVFGKKKLLYIIINKDTKNNKDNCQIRHHRLLFGKYPPLLIVHPPYHLSVHRNEPNVRFFSQTR